MSTHHPHNARAGTLRTLTDCPKCKFGTVDKRLKHDFAAHTETIFYRCADCQTQWTEEQWKALKP